MTGFGVLDRVLVLMNEHVQKYGTSPTHVGLTAVDWVGICGLGPDVLGADTASALVSRGQQGLGRLYGMEVEWGAKDTWVDARSRRRPSFQGEQSTKP